ncbi:ABC transporter permease [Desulfotomaculum nigrificans]|uniref:ABC transporter permease n=1 Tax=Desulfotomaculum nigrificans TaxID=1565 RepID=UPI0001FAE1C1|nr:ABC transporter permease subunit [Desulfotomaculum nigrificans]
MFNIARLTFWEVTRKKVFLVTILLSLAFLLLYGIALHFTAQEIVRMKAMGQSQLMIQQVVGNQILGAGLYFASFLLALLALLASVGSIASEIENGLLHAIVSKPIKRREIVLGKFIGYGSMLAAYAMILYGGILGLNWYYNAISLTFLSPARTIYGALIFILQPLVLLSVAMVCSTLVRTLTAGIISTILFGLAMVGGFLEQIGNLVGKTTLVNIGIATSLVMPSDALFRKLLSVVAGSDVNPLSSLSLGPFGVAVPPSNAMLVYTCLYILGGIGLAIYNFNQKDL